MYICNDIARAYNDTSCTKFMRRSRAGKKPGLDTATPKLIGMLMNNKLVSLARGVSMALGTVRKCGRDSAAGILSLILLFTMPLISVIFATAQPHFYRMVTCQSSLICSPSVICYLLSRSILGSSASIWLNEEKNFFICHPIGETYVIEPQLQRVNWKRDVHHLVD